MSEPEPSTALVPVVESLTEEATAPAIVQGQPALVRPGTWTALATTAASFGLAIAAAPAWWLLAIPAVIVAIVMTGTDLSLGSPRKRETPKAALRLYSRAIHKGKWNKAFACVHPDAPLEIDRVPEFHNLKVAARPADVSRPSGYKNFWKALTHPGQGMVRQRYKVKTMLPPQQGDVQTAHVQLSVHHYPTWVYVGLLLGLLPCIILMLIVRKREELYLDVTLYKHKSQWWVHHALPTSEEPARLPVARLAA